MRIIGIALLVLLAGCQTFMQPTGGMSAEQIAAIVKDKNGNVLCISAIGPYGTYVLKNVTLDSGVIRDGGVQVSGDCKDISIQTMAPPRVVPPPKPVP